MKQWMRSVALGQVWFSCLVSRIDNADRLDHDRNTHRQSPSLVTREE